MQCVTVALACLALGSPVRMWCQGASHVRLPSGASGHESSLVAVALPGAPHVWPEQEQPELASPRAARFAVELGGGVLGAVVVSIPSALIGSGFGPNKGDDPGLLGAVFGFLLGSAAGSALGVYAAGEAQGDQGRFGSALVGSMVGLVTFLLAAPGLDGDQAHFFATAWGLPAAGATLCYGASRPRATNRRIQMSPGGLRTQVVMQATGGIGLGLSIAF